MPGPSSDWPDYPFCSKRCRTIDLGRWLGESYRIPAVTTPEDDDSRSSTPDNDDQSH
jgi:endogenous inhibitor of DNA gyrase (YacG/DUF329 family)